MMVIKSLRESKVADFDFVEAVDGQDALGKFHADRPDILFVDWNMPNMTGIELVREIRTVQRTHRTPIVMVTSEKTQEKVTEAMRYAGADAYICKPFTVAELQQKLPPLVAAVK